MVKNTKQVMESMESWC